MERLKEAKVRAKLERKAHNLWKVMKRPRGSKEPGTTPGVLQ